MQQQQQTLKHSRVGILKEKDNSMASQREKSPAKSNADRIATQVERNEARNAGTGVSFLRSKLKATDRGKK